MDLDTVRPASKALMSRIRRINPLLPFGPLSTKSKTTIQYRDRSGTSTQDVQAPSGHSRTKFSRVNTEADQSTQKKATFQWVKGELLGKGSYAKVYLGLNATTGELMAVKQVELPQTISDQSSSRHREITEALNFERKTLMGLDHQNIVQYLGYEESLEYLSIFLEYVPGGTISSCLKNHGKFSEEVTKSFSHQMLVGLEYLHCMGILHRDLKSDNILVELSGVCKIADFGISKQAEDIIQGRAFTGMRGTIYWMAPEVLDTDKKTGYDVKVDIWSVGCVVLEMWTGERPWHGEEMLPVMFKLSQEKLSPPIPPDLLLSDSASDFRRQCFQINPHDRPSAAELQAHPYLVLPPGWRFEPSEIEPSRLRRSSSQTSLKSRKSVKSNRHFLSSPSGNFEDVPSVPSISGKSRYSTHQPLDKLHASETDTPRPSLSHHKRSDSKHKLDHGPALVWITPPNPPPSQITELPNNSSRTSLDTSGPVSTTRKGFRIINPDPEPEIEKEPFLYQPPPLPSVSPYSARLFPPVVYGASEAYPSPRLISGNAQPLSSPESSASFGGGPRRKMASCQLSRRQTKASLTSDVESDSDGDDEIWAVPPADLSTRGVPSRNHARSSSRNGRASKAPSRISIYGEWARPVPAEVYENLQDFFPKYNLDKAVNPTDSTPAERSEDRQKRVKKSIRMVAEEQNNRAQLGMRRRTKLWNSKVEELRM